MSNKIKRVLILCTGNSARSQMAEGLLRCGGGEAFVVESAGLDPSSVRPEAVAVMRELGIDISSQRSKSLAEFLQQSFDYVITVCDNANQHCPMFAGVARRVHWSIRDPARTMGDEPTRLQAFREARDELRKLLREFIAAEKRAAG